MKSEDDELGESALLRLGRQFMDGASFEWLSEHTGRSTGEISAAWEYCREMLSRYFAAADKQDFRLLSDEEIQAESEGCVRLLLEWQEAHDRSLIDEKFKVHVDGAEQSSVTDVDEGELR